jgi:hypothetical protein
VVQFTVVLVLTVTIMSSSTSTEVGIADAVRAAKEQIKACDDKSAIYKAALRSLGEDDSGRGSGAGDDSAAASTEPNTLSVQWIKVWYTRIEWNGLL